MLAEFLSFPPPVHNFDPAEPLVCSITSLNIQGHFGYAYLDSGARLSLAGSQLRKLLIADNVPFETKPLTMTLASGEIIQTVSDVFHAEVILKNRTHIIKLVSVPQHVNSRTLLGVDFLKNANIIIDIRNSA